MVDLDEELNEIAGHLNAQHARLAGVARELLDDPAKWALLCRNKVLLFRRRNGVVRSAAFYLCTVVREASRAATGRATSRAALRVLVRPRLLRRPAGPEWLATMSGQPASAKPLHSALG